jgi:hypothetical protein
VDLMTVVDSSLEPQEEEFICLKNIAEELTAPTFFNLNFK